jgi:hypothetical protein
MKDTDEFLGLASELVDLMKIVVAEATEKVRPAFIYVLVFQSINALADGRG